MHTHTHIIHFFYRLCSTDYINFVATSIYIKIPPLLIEQDDQPPCDTKNKIMPSCLTKKKVVVFVCDHTPWYKTWLDVLPRVQQEDEMEHKLQN